jgi:hypothetical protein
VLSEMLAKALSKMLNLEKCAEKSGKMEKGSVERPEKW